MLFRPTKGGVSVEEKREDNLDLRQRKTRRQLTQALVELMEELAAGCTEAEYARLEDIFVTCSRYELGFWEMAWTLER